MRRLFALLLTAAPAMAQDGDAAPGADGADAPRADGADAPRADGAEAAVAAAYTVLNASAIPEPLTPTPGDPEAGAAVWSDHCAGCHAAGDAPAAEALAQRREAGALRLAVVNLAIARPDVEGHAFHDLGGEEDTAAPALSAQAVEDVVAWLRRSAR